jgi:hypothetical protein
MKDTKPTMPSHWIAHTLTRRRVLGAAALGWAAPLIAATRTKTVAAVVTEYRWYSHADVVLGRILGGNSANGVYHPPRTKLVSLYTEQVPQNDMSRDMASRNGFRIYPTIEQALTLGGGRLAVDAVIFIGEHGNYPTNDAGQKLYPRFELFSKILDVYEKNGRGLPTFFDKHLSYSWEKAKTMYDRAKKLGFPFLAGSSIPLTVRTPALDLALETPVERAVVVGYGDLDAYGFHTLESMQCIVERRAGGETGVAAVTMLEGEAVWRWHDGEDGAWSRPLLEAALARHGNGLRTSDVREGTKPALFLLDYRDGLRAAAYMLNPRVTQWCFAARIQGQSEPVSTRFGPAQSTRPLPHFDGLVHCIEEMFLNGKAPYPVERTLLTTGALSLLFESRRRRGVRVETPELAVTYRSPAKVFVQTA